MAQAQIDMDLNLPNSTKHSAKKESTKRTSVTKKDVVASMSKKFHSMPLTLRIQSKPLQEGVSPRVILDDDWILYIGGRRGEIGGNTHINIRKINLNGSGNTGSSIGDLNEEGLSMPVEIINCLLEGLSQLNNYHRL
ncbi:unnamed protein product [Allacma fusca]|uniref:Uncharacterized protein n=1 Tax=Allacma fusca TaxID=39272 RepID=A0A8J2NSW4_9HEXA|nr:unnamed protein product [Allacma fusca]